MGRWIVAGFSYPTQHTVGAVCCLVLSSGTPVPVHLSVVMVAFNEV